MTTVIALGDLHSQLATLPRLKQVQAKYPDAITVFIGDYIDTYGVNHGFELLEQIFAMKRADPKHTIVLRGNHEQGMSDYFADATHVAWLQYGGNFTLEAIMESLPDAIGDPREVILDEKLGLIDWVEQLPLTYTIGHLIFVHAGLDLTALDPVTTTSNYDCLWMRATYWYAPDRWGVFDHNKLDASIITGHTPNESIQGRYRHDEHPAKQESDYSPIYAISYPQEYPRYLMDGGAGNGDERRLGNIGVFDSETGLLIDAYED